MSRAYDLATTKAVLNLLGVDYHNKDIVSVDLHLCAVEPPTLKIVQYVNWLAPAEGVVVKYREITDVTPSVQGMFPAPNNDTDDWK